MIVALSSLGLPMLNGFVGEFLIILGAFHSRALFGALAAVGVVLAAVYLLWMYQRVFLGEVTSDKNRSLPDCDLREKIMLTAAVAVILAGVLLKMGTYGMLRFCLPLFPGAAKQFAPLISVFAIISILYGSTERAR